MRIMTYTNTTCSPINPKNYFKYLQHERKKREQGEDIRCIEPLFFLK